MLTIVSRNINHLLTKLIEQAEKCEYYFLNFAMVNKNLAIPISDHLTWKKRRKK